MEYRRLGKSGLQVSAVGLGTNNFGTRLDEQASIWVVREAIDQGITMLDTADIYGRGLSEQYTGKAVKGMRHKVIVATKFASPMGEGPHERGASRQHIMKAVEDSLSRLDTDYIDLYQVHIPDPATPIEETLRALDDLIHQGKVRYIGCSNFAAWQVCDGLWTSRTLGLHSFISVQPQYSLLSRSIERELIPFCQAFGVGIIPYLPLAGGLLTGKYRAGQPALQGTRLAGPQGPRFLTEENFALLSLVEDFVSQRGRALLELAIGWLLAKPQVATVIAGATTPQQVRDNVAAGEAWRLTAAEVQQVDEITLPALNR